MRGADSGATDSTQDAGSDATGADSDVTSTIRELQALTISGEAAPAPEKAAPAPASAPAPEPLPTPAASPAKVQRKKRSVAAHRTPLTKYTVRQRGRFKSPLAPQSFNTQGVLAPPSFTQQGALAPPSFTQGAQWLQQ